MSANNYYITVIYRTAMCNAGLRTIFAADNCAAGAHAVKKCIGVFGRFFYQEMFS